MRLLKSLARYFISCTTKFAGKAWCAFSKVGRRFSIDLYLIYNKKDIALINRILARNSGALLYV
jgi:hypothetical protein